MRFKDIFLCILSGIIMALPFSFGALWILAWFGFLPLFFALQGKSKIKAFLLSSLTGIVFWWGTIYWLVHVTLPGTIVLIFYLALYFGIFGSFFVTACRKPSSITYLLIPSVWVLLEYGRSYLLTGFPWALLAYSQQLNLPLIQISDITGAWGVSFLVMMGNVMIYLGIRKEKKKIFAGILILFVSLAYGFFKLYTTPATNHPEPIKISVIQANIPQDLKWQESARDFIIRKYLGFNTVAASARPDLLIWPEAALPVVLEEEPEYYRLLINNVRQIKTPLLFGAVTQSKGLYYNSACLVSGEGQFLERYDKIHLVPFGEYIPLKKALPFLETIVPIGDITPGRQYSIFEVPNSKVPNKFSVLICFEDLFPELSREFVRRGASFLVNITNDAWYKKTSAAAQHFQASVFRAVENRVYLVRAANTGISGFIAPSGRIVSLVRDSSGSTIFIDGITTQVIPIERHGPTFYGEKGDFFILLLLLFVIYGISRKFKNV